MSILLRHNYTVEFYWLLFVFTDDDLRPSVIHICAMYIHTNNSSCVCFSFEQMNKKNAKEMKGKRQEEKFEINCAIVSSIILVHSAHMIYPPASVCISPLPPQTNISLLKSILSCTWSFMYYERETHLLTTTKERKENVFDCVYES